MITALAFAVAAGLGALARTEAGRRWNRHGGFPLGTLAVNVSGAFALGLLSPLAPPAATVLGVGALGGYTTFSSFARDAAALAEQRGRAEAVAYVVATYALGLSAAAAGLAVSGGL